MAYSKNKYGEDKFVNKLIEERTKHLKTTEKKAIEWLKKKNYYSLSKEEKKEFLLTEKGLALIEALAKEDLPFVYIARALSLSQKELHEYSRENDKIYDAIDMGRAKKLNVVEDALYLMAKDRYIEETRISVHKSERSNNTTTTEDTYKKFIPANWNAVKYIMEQKKSMEYKKIRDEELDNNKERVNFVINIADVGLPTVKKEDSDD